MPTQPQQPRCRPINLSAHGVTPGWGCCACEQRDGMGTFNGEARTTCKACGHGRCDVPPKAAQH